MTTPRLLLQYDHQKRLFSGPGSSPMNGPRSRVALPPGGSTLMTSAPKSASAFPHQLNPPSLKSTTR